MTFNSECDRSEIYTYIIYDEHDYYSNPLNQYLKTRRPNHIQLKDEIYERPVSNLDESVTNHPSQNITIVNRSDLVNELDTRQGCNYTVCKFVEFNDTKITKVPTDAQTSIPEDLIEDCGLPLEYTNKITAALQYASLLISNRRVKHNLEYELCIDYEFPDWKMIKITFNVDLVDIRDEFEESVYRAISSRLPDHILKNIIIEFDSL